MRNWLLFIVVLLGAVGCKKPQSVVENIPPETTIAIDSIQRTGELRLNANVHLHWYGSDADGFIDYFKVKVNEGVELETKSTDSVFTFVIDAGLDSSDVRIQVTAVDHLGGEDPTPAYLWVPLKNAAPTCQIDADNIAPDSAKIVLTLRWNAEDIDGDETIVEAEVRLNNGPWTGIDLGQGLLSFSLQPNGTKASLFQNGFLVDSSMIGAVANDENVVYLRVKDWAGKTLVKKGSVDTVLVCFVDMQGRLMGKRFHGVNFIDFSYNETHCCNYLLATDLEMATPDGYASTSWETGYGDYVMKPDLSTIRPLP